MRHRKTKRAGGWFDSLSMGSISEQGNSLSQKANEYWSSASNTLSSYNPFKKNENVSSSSVTTTASYVPPTTSTYGGRKNRRTKNKRGGSRMTNFPLTPATYEGGPSIRYNLVGGRTRKRRKHGRKSRKH